MYSQNRWPRSVFYGLLAVSMAALAADFVFIYIPLSGWILQAVFVSLYLEYLGLKKTIAVIAILEVFFMASYGGATFLAVILSLVGTRYFLPLVISLYFLVMIIALLLGCATNYLFHKIGLFERIGSDSHKQNHKRSQELVGSGVHP